jgi:ornithine decarboxylase
MNRKIAHFLAKKNPETPCLVVDLDLVAANFTALERAMPWAKIYYAVKANPAAPILSVLNHLKSFFDAASIYEIEHCLQIGVAPDRLSYGSTIKKQRDIAAAFARGVRLFAFDSLAELEKIAVAAPGSRVFCRILMEGDGADWPLSDKFGCDGPMAADLLSRARDLDLHPAGVSFHVGSQQRDPGQWDIALARTAKVFATLSAAGIALGMINLGGGFPARYQSDIDPLEDYARAMKTAVKRHFGDLKLELIIEPGRGIVGDAGLIQSEVVLISKKFHDAERRWVYLDVGMFGGLPETMGEAIKYRIRTPRDGGPTGSVVLAGPTCDEVDVLYEEADYRLPLDLTIGDKIEILSAGAYTATYASIGFNGFPPLREFYI